MPFEVTKEFEFCASHLLPSHPKCGRIHGHNYRVLVEFAGDDTHHMVVDFGEVSRQVQPIIDELDHGCLNDIMAMPTAENVAQYIFKQITFRWQFTNESETLKSVTIYETPTSCARYHQ